MEPGHGVGTSWIGGHGPAHGLAGTEARNRMKWQGREVRGGVVPSSWRFVSELTGPDGTESRTVPWEGACLFRWAWDPEQPWRGIAPLWAAASTGRLAGGLENALADESGTPRGYLLPTPAIQSKPLLDDGGGDPLAAMKADLKKLGGGLSVVETMAGGYGEGRAAAPLADWKTQRIGANPPEVLCTLRGDVHRTVLSACGIPASMMGDRSDGSARRESFRYWAHAALQPLVNRLEAEFQAKLEMTVTLDLSPLYASDLTGRARAFQSLVGAGMEVEKAAGLAGLLQR